VVAAVLLAAFLATPLSVLGFAAEFSLMLWLLIAGVNPTRWNEKAAAAAASRTGAS